MARTLELLLTENVEGTGIVGDVVKVRKGFARNYLMPRNFATTPSPEKIKDLASKREDAQRALAALRKEREGIISKLEGHAIDLVRSCNDLGILYGGITQGDICDVLNKGGFPGIKHRDIRIGAAIKRIGDYDVHVKFESDLEAVVKLHVKPDRELDMGRRHEPEHPPAAAGAAAPAAEGAEAKAPEGKDGKTAKPAPAAKGEKPAKGKGEKPEKADKAEKQAEGAPAADGKRDEAQAAKPKGKGGKDGKGGKGEGEAPAASKSKTGWGAAPEVPAGLSDLLKPRRERRERR
jgi:large subunit ribosomal protein L9